MAESWFLFWTENYNYSCVSEFAWSEVIDKIEFWSCLYCEESMCITCGSEQDTVYKIIYAKMCIWCKTMCLIPYSLLAIFLIMWHIFTSTNNTTAILFPTQLWELLCTYHVIKQCTEKETTSLSIFLLTIKLNYLHDLKIVLSSTPRHEWGSNSQLEWW
jgi:hypothetical protein